MRKSASWRAALVAALVLAIAGTLYADAPATDQGPNAALSAMELPFTTPIGNNPVVQFKVNESTDINLAIDTGASANVISESLAKKLGLQPKPYLVDGNPYLLGGKPSSFVTVSSLSANPYLFRNFGFLVADDKYFSVFKQYSVDGILGLGMLSTMVVLIDFGKHKISFMDSSRLTQDEIGALGFRPYPLTMSISDNGNFQVPVALANGAYSTTEQMEIDTGAPNTTISRHDADQLHSKTGENGEQGGPFLDPIAVSAVKLDKIIVGDVTLLAGSVLCYKEDGKDSAPDLGMDILSQSRILFDFPAKKMYIEPASSPYVLPIPPQPAPAK